jgi:hypothetical protein
MRFSEVLRSSLGEALREVNVERRVESEADQLQKDLLCSPPTYTHPESRDLSSPCFILRAPDLIY